MCIRDRYKLNFGVYLSPAENLCYTSMKKFKEKYGIIPNVSDKDFFTNSTHVPVWVDMTPIEKTVSYTHLDVYKRQDYYHKNIWKKIFYKI